MEIVPRQEIRQRISRFQEELAANDLDGAFILQNQMRIQLAGQRSHWASDEFLKPLLSALVLAVAKNSTCSI